MKNEEFILLLGLIIYPEMLPDMELQLHEISGKLFSALEYLKSIELDKLANGGSYTALMNLKRRKIIDEKEYVSLFEKIGEHDFTSMDIYNTYLAIKEDYKKNKIQEKLSTVDFQKETLETLTEIMSDVIKDLEQEAPKDDLQTFADILPLCNEKQKSLITFNHHKMQTDIAIDSNYLTLLCARPSTGKTTFAIKLIMENCTNSKGLYLSCEMSKVQIVRKSLNYKYGYSNIKIDYVASLSIADISRLVKQHKPKFVVIDQFNKIIGLGKTEYERFTYIAKQLKILAVRLDIPIICLAQINRTAEQGKRPMLHHLKGSGSLEEEADVVLILDILPDDIDKKLFTRVYCDKNRSLDGNIGYYDFEFDKPTNKYKEKIF